jgi:hypothetical protein
MRKSALEIYAFAVCLVSVVFLLVSAAIGSNELVRVFFPSVTVGGYVHEQSMSDAQYLRLLPQNQPAPQTSEIPRLRREALESALRSERQNGLSAFLQSLMYVVAAGVVFRLHWRIGRRERLNAIVSAG